MENELFAEMRVVIFRWEEDDAPRFGVVIYTNYEDSLEAAAKIGIDDECVLIYTDTLDPEEIRKSFDGLLVEFLPMENES